jgi:hypothetical protein
VSQTVLLCEDRPQASLVRSYMHCCGLNTNEPWFISRIASELAQGGNVRWVLREFPRQLQACRQRHARARTLMIVMVDANSASVDERHRELNSALEGAGFTPMDSSDPTAILIPKRHIETWIRAASGDAVNEADDYKYPSLTREGVRQAAQRIHGWAHDNPAADDRCVSSLKMAFPEWRKIG